MLINMGSCAVSLSGGENYTSELKQIVSTAGIGTITGTKWFFATSPAVLLLTTSNNVARSVSNWTTSSPTESANISGGTYGNPLLYGSGTSWTLTTEGLKTRLRQGIQYTFSGSSFSGIVNSATYTYSGSVSGYLSIGTYFDGTRYLHPSTASTTRTMSYMTLAGALGSLSISNDSMPAVLSSVRAAAPSSVDGTLYVMRSFNSATTTADSRTVIQKINYNTLAVENTYKWADAITFSPDGVASLVSDRYFCMNVSTKSEVYIYDTVSLDVKTVSGYMIGYLGDRILVFRITNVGTQYGEIYAVNPSNLLEKLVQSVSYTGTNPISGAPTINNFRSIMPSNGYYPIYISGATSGNVLFVANITAE